MNPLTAKIKPHVPAIVKDAGNGCGKASNVITLYQMYIACPSDHAAPALCEAAFDDWFASAAKGGAQ